jgi:hypothetical protein
VHFEEYGHVLELMLLDEVREIRYCHVREADLVKIQTLAQVEHDAEVEATNVSESTGAWHSFPRWLE